MSRDQLEIRTPILLRQAKRQGCDCEPEVGFIEAAGELGVAYLGHRQGCGWQETEPQCLPKWA
jgi:hypothetical protein